MAVTKVMITDISRPATKLYGDGKVLDFTITGFTKIDFLYILNDYVFESSTELCVTGEETFINLENKIKDIMNNQMSG
ncbi:hypothetical protein [Lentibacillus salicampi]|uniref:Uncharacterized protein n=1 Tax=Lentibacillus salicampi TaxID=175306 RepID=A0A4Y9A8J0_9BACI|nr:hypothetical protein [Lentibacillus salicampi]TFJ92149.1 hypothetical protein E4U82_13800 [Lentibacillus salicampi]